MEKLQQAFSLVGTNRHVQAGVAIVASLILARLADWVLVHGVSRLADRTKTDLDDRIISSLRKPLFNSIMLTGLAVALRLEQMPESWAFYIFAFLKSLVVLVWVVFGIRIVGLIFHAMAVNPSRFDAVQPATLPVFEIGSKVVLFGAAVYFILISWSVDPTGWVASAGIIGIAIGFAAKDTLANLFAGVFILADAPYKVGDFIELEGQRGRVIKIGLRSTRILTRDDIEITIPNSTIANGKIVNESGGPSVKHRLRIPIGVAYGSDVDRVREVLQSVADNDGHICREPAPRVRFRSFGDSSLNFEILCWIEDPALRGLVIDALNTSIYKALAQSRIEIPFPKRDVYIKQLPPSSE